MAVFRHVGVLTIIFVLVAMVVDKAEARERKFVIPFVVGQTDEMVCLEDIALAGDRGEALCVAAYNVYFFFFAGIRTRSTLVLAQKTGDAYYPMPPPAELRRLQDRGLIPAPLPSYSRPAFDYVYGYSLWIILAAIAVVYLLRKSGGARSQTSGEFQRWWTRPDPE